MDRTYTCLRCVRRLTAVAPKPSRRGTPDAQQRWKRSFSSTSDRTPSLQHVTKTSLARPQTPARASRLVHTSIPLSQQTATLERHDQTSNDLPNQSPIRLKPDNLFHPFSKSPIAAIRQRAAFIKRNAYCPHPSHHQTRSPFSPYDPEGRKGPGVSTQPPAHANFECPDCGIASYCSEEHWLDDYEEHLEVCDTLRQVNEDDHDLRSGRFFSEFEYPPPQIDEILPNLGSWDLYLYTRAYEAIDSERSMRQATRLLTYPLTIASVLHEFSPYNIRAGGRLTTEGLKSLSGEYSCPVLTEAYC
jgi:hypothetical protein